MSVYWDIKPVCKNRDQHYQIRRWLRGLPSLGFMDGTAAVLVVPNWKDPCKTRILTEGVNPPPIASEILQSADIGAALLSSVEFGKRLRPVNCRCVMVYVSINEEYFNEKA